MGRVRFVAVPLLAAAIFAWASSPATAQTKEARGTATTVTDSSITVNVNGTNMKFAVDNNTIVGAPGAGRATRDAQTKGAAGAKLTGILKPGAGVIVTYREAGLVATEIRLVPAAAEGAAGAGRAAGAVAGAAGAAAGAVAGAAGAAAGAVTGAGGQTANGRVKSVSDTAVVITDSGKDLTFAVNATTRVQGRGAGTATQAAGGKIPITKLVGVGDQVSVSYTGTAPKMVASEIRITVNADRAPTPAGR